MNSCPYSFNIIGQKRLFVGHVYSDGLDIDLNFSLV
jgi:hypothetical protein